MLHLRVSSWPDRPDPHFRSVDNDYFYGGAVLKLKTATGWVQWSMYGPTLFVRGPDGWLDCGSLQ